MAISVTYLSVRTWEPKKCPQTYVVKVKEHSLSDSAPVFSHECVCEAEGQGTSGQAHSWRYYQVRKIVFVSLLMFNTLYSGLLLPWSFLRNRWWTALTSSKRPFMNCSNTCHVILCFDIINLISIPRIVINLHITRL